MDVNLAFCRRLLSRTFIDVRKVIPKARARDACVARTMNSKWIFELNRPCYGGHFQWIGRADNAYHAKIEGWNAFIEKRKND